MLVASNITMQFGAKPLFENVSVKFGEGFRYGLIGANGSGKSTFMKIIAGELEPSAGNISKDAHERMAEVRIVNTRIAVCTVILYRITLLLQIFQYELLQWKTCMVACNTNCLYFHNTLNF